MRGATPCEVRVIGIGSAAGDDRLGWLAVQALQARPALRRRPGLTFLSLDRPGPALIAYLAGARRVIVIDALCGAGAVGELLEPSIDELADDAGAWSSHGLGVGAALQLARALDQLPPCLQLLALRCPPPTGCWPSGGAQASATAPALSAAVCAALPALLARAEALIVAP